MCIFLVHYLHSILTNQVLCLLFVIFLCLIICVRHKILVHSWALKLDQIGPMSQKNEGVRNEKMANVLMMNMWGGKVYIIIISYSWYDYIQECFVIERGLLQVAMEDIYVIYRHVSPIIFIKPFFGCLMRWNIFI